MSYLFFSLIIMAVMTYSIRVTPLAFFNKRIDNQWIKDFLYYIPFCILASMTFPEVIYSTSPNVEELHLISGFTGTITAIIIAWKERGLLVVAIWAVIVAAITEWLIGYFL
ncbi:MAG: AzlD domain-containing protein [Bacteroidales bacterium]|nr:AzlD domain-containing protein [Bacteroidales bacterium]